MRIQTIVYVRNMDASVEWYRAVLDSEPVTHGSHWSSFHVGGANLALHFVERPLDPGRVELSLVCTEALEDLVTRLESNDISMARGIADETFGRSIQLRDPEGMIVQVNEHDAEYYDE